MPRITPISWKKFEKFLLYVDCYFKRDRGDLKRPIVVPRVKEFLVFVIKNNLGINIYGLQN